MIRVFRVGDITKNLVKVVILIIGIILFTRFFNGIRKIDWKNLLENRLNSLNNKTFTEVLDENLDEPVINKDENNIISEELDFIKSAFLNDPIIASKKFVETEKNENDENVGENLTTEVISEHNKEDTYNAQYSNVLIKNDTGFELTEEMLTPNIEFDKTNVVIYHTHTSESYTPTEENQYEANGNFRTLDTEHNVVRVGEELKSRLESKNINVIHDATFHDYPEYNGSYDRALVTAKSILESNSCDLVIDLHRDALGDSTYAPSVMIGDEKAAQIMFVMGTNGGGLNHPNWNNNLKIAIKIQQKANELYPGLCKPIILKKYRYNQHVAKGACIIEVGATGNTLEECLVSMKYLAEVIANV